MLSGLRKIEKKLFWAPGPNFYWKGYPVFNLEKFRVLNLRFLFLCQLMNVANTFLFTVIKSFVTTYHIYFFFTHVYGAMSRISGLSNAINKRTFYKERKINNRCFDFLSKENIIVPLILDINVSLRVNTWTTYTWQSKVRVSLNQNIERKKANHHRPPG